MAVAKIAVVICGALAIFVGLAFREANIAWMVGLALAVAASTFFPVLAMGIWWRRTTEQGAFAGLLVGGLISAVVVIGHLAGFWPFDQPAIVSVPAAFLAIYVVSMLTQDQPESVWEIWDAAFHALHHPDSDLPEPEEMAEVAETAEVAEFSAHDEIETLPRESDEGDS
ncbi:MAG: hypothetical protein U9R79_15405 [Armatimonadota bacterium]|nr:hypothetical protein [Armatimonadota bacterium]